MTIDKLDFESFFELCGACSIILIPFLIGILLTRRYHIFYGIVSYFFFNYILCFIFLELSTTINFFSENQCYLVISASVSQYNLIYESILLIPNIKQNIASNEKFIVLTIVFTVYLLLHMTFMAIDKVKN